MDFTPLKAEQKKFFEENGFLVVPDVLDKAETLRVMEAGDRLAHSFLNKGEILNKPWYNDLDYRPGLLYEPALFDLVSNATIVSLLVQLLSPNIHLHSTAITYKRKENPDFSPFRRGWHRDIRIPRDLGHEQLPLVGIKACYCLTDFDPPDSGITIFAGKSHLCQEPLKISNNQVDPQGYQICDLKLKAGDVVLFENRVYHTATPNKSNQTAKRIIYGYSYRWMRPEIYLDVPDKNLLKKADPITRQLIGGYRDIDTPPWALQDWAKRHNVLKKPVPWFINVSSAG